MDDATPSPAAAAAGCPLHAHASTPQHGSPGGWPPGPRAAPLGWPLLRRMSHDLLGTLAEVQQRFGDVVHLRIWPEHQVMLADPALVRELLVAHHDGLVRWERGMQVLAQLHGASVFVSEGAAWRGKRHALQPAFSPKAVQAFVPTMADAAGQALARWPAQSARWPVESALTLLAMDVVLRLLFSSGIGEDARAAEDAVRTAGAAADREFYWPASWPDAMPWKRAKRRALATLRGLVERHLRQRLAQPPEAWPDDLLAQLLHLHNADAAAWPLQAVRDECMTAFLAGHETVAATLAWWARCLASHPAAQREAAAEVRAQLQGRPPEAADLPRLGAVTRTLQETLRLYPAAPVLATRRATGSLTLGAWRLPARTMFLLPVGLMQRDPRWFPDPLAFQPQRFAPGAPEVPRGAYLPFGAGPRVCLGQHLAMAEMTVVAALVLQRFELAVPEGEPPPRPLLKVSLRPDRPLHLRLAPAGTAA